jgi:hypothetical protein
MSLLEVFNLIDRELRVVRPLIAGVLLCLLSSLCMGDQPPRPRLVLSEIVYWPAKPGLPVQIELWNRGEKAIDASGWSLVDKDEHAYVIPVGTLVPPGGFLVVQFGPKVQTQPTDIPPSSGSAPYLNCAAEWAGKAFRGHENECALYSSAQRGSSHLEDFVRWGRRSASNPAPDTTAHTHALERSMWAKGHGVYVGNDLRPGDSPPLIAGGSIAWKPRRAGRPLGGQWYINTPDNVTMGAPNRWPMPVIQSPWGDQISFEGQKQRFSWRGETDEDGIYHVQVSTDPDFRQLILEKGTRSDPVEKVLEPGKYYWRVREESGGSTGKWSTVASFEILASAAASSPAP